MNFTWRFYSCPGGSWLAIACTFRYCGPELGQEVSQVQLACHQSLLLSLFQPSGSEEAAFIFCLAETFKVHNIPILEAKK